MDILIVARMGSSRLPGKTLEKIDSKKTMLGFLISRLKKSSKISRVILATSNLTNDNVLSDWADNNNILVYRGDSENVLKRISNCVKNFNIDRFAFILGDNPLIDHQLLDHCINLYDNKTGLDFLTTHSMEFSKYHNSENMFPVGIRIQIMNRSTINQINNEVKNNFNQEHSTSYIIENLKSFKTFFVKPVGEFSDYALPNYNFAVNTSEQLNCIKKIVLKLEDLPNFKLSDVIEIVTKNKNEFNNIKL
tara:strand:+ start:456 stop:1202 length:747 start_codon:yes stop_codon:yes gene_type:complete